VSFKGSSVFLLASCSDVNDFLVLNNDDVVEERVNEGRMCDALTTNNASCLCVQVLPRFSATLARISQ